MEQPQKNQVETSNQNMGAIFGEDPNSARFGAFNGVFRPTILTILGVMMYLREGWVVGHGGLVGAILVILSCYVITGATALSISSITTNIRVGSGGVFSIISQSLGLEVGGAVGIPLYLAQGLSAALYMQGILETWLYIFPDHNVWLTKLAIFLVSFIIASFGATLAFRVQVVVMVGAVLALASMAMGLTVNPINPTPVLWGDFNGPTLTGLFAVFFPAATGIMVGSSLSGSLKNPRTAIPKGTLSAWALSLIVYLLLAVWYAILGDPAELTDTTKIFAVEKAWWGPLVLVGVISSCFSATLSSLVASPRVLQALATYGVSPYSGFFEKQVRGEPRNATLFTGAIVLVSFLLGDLNTIAQILTMFFLVIYFMINLVLFIEHRLQMISFRPIFPIAHWVPVVGVVTCFSAILVISPFMGLLAIAFILGIYAYLDYRKLQTPWETVHSGIFAGIANWAAMKVINTQTAPTAAKQRSWKPDLLIPVERSTQLEGYYRLAKALTYPRGSIQVAVLANEHDDIRIKRIERLVADFQHEGIYSTSAVVEATEFASGLRTCISVKKGSFFKPNTIFASTANREETELQAIVDNARNNHMGVVLAAFHPESKLGRERCVNLWVRDQSPDWQLGLKLANLDYSVLMSYQLKVNWGARIRVLTVVSREEDIAPAREFLTKLMEYARMSEGVEIIVLSGSWKDQLAAAPKGDVNILGLTETVNKENMELMVTRAQSSCLFVLDSGIESALA